MDKNLWHLSHEGMDLEDPWNEPQFDKILQMMVSPEKAPDTPTYVEIYFEKGIPKKINGKEYAPAVSYTHLDVYKRQTISCSFLRCLAPYLVFFEKEGLLQPLLPFILLV